MTVVDVNTGKFVGSGGNLEETVTKNNIEAAEEIVRQLRLRDIGGIIVIDFIDMVLESNRDLVVRRLLECLGRDRTKHQVAEVTSLGLVQMTRKRVGQRPDRGLLRELRALRRPRHHRPRRPGRPSGGCRRWRLAATTHRWRPLRPGTPRPARRRQRSAASRGSQAAAEHATSGPTPAQIAAAAHAAALKQRDACRVADGGAGPGRAGAAGGRDRAGGRRQRLPAAPEPATTERTATSRAHRARRAHRAHREHRGGRARRAHAAC